jgi:hypothetical protein
MADKKGYSIYDENGNVVMSFVGNSDLMDKALGYGKLTKNTRNEMMLIVGNTGLELSNWNFALGFKVYMRPNWSLVKHIS